MSKTAVDKAIGWRLEKQAGSESVLNTATGQGTSIWSGLDADQKRKVIMMLVSGGLGAGAGYLGGRAITKNKDSKGMALTKQIGGGILGAGAGALAGGAASMGVSVGNAGAGALNKLLGGN
jgi:hypothetical protein